MALFATDSEVLWLNIMNGTLGLVVLVCVVVAAGAVIFQFRAVRRERARNVSGADREMNALLGTRGDHAFEVPGLGLTMADGGERIDPDRDKKAR